MLNKILKLISESFSMEEKNMGEYKEAKVSLFKFSSRSFDVKGLGNVSVMTGKALFGLMKMDTVIINPFEKEMPLFSYDRIYAMGNDTAYIELFDTRIKRDKFSDRLDKVLEEYSDIPDQPAPPNWYDDIKLGGCRKKGKKSAAPRFDEMTLKYLREYLDMCAEAESCDKSEKIKAASAYTEGLLSQGGPSTDMFVKTKGAEFTTTLYRDYLFGTGTPENK